ncbi:hypothetical protein ACFQ3P_30190 [Paraburkholderia sabiae]|uniref:Uncharacterized protein n=1 Tax=Paraburkholderia sabiae TaxID=273251 RepID=A0ABU9QNA6_9BURK|nr:hypothetical protein [Paraburkholderia sabiae]WJZ74907.1 hypothetical protein QEN71_03570 [Paraburkholderia sabiae]CAD6551382.1 hypothetical protein LMG24235_04927 [Paraburkholderia sabiae]
MTLAIAVLSAILAAYAGGACASKSYDDYDTFYTAQPRAVFEVPIASGDSAAYANPGEPGIYTELQSDLDGKLIHIVISSNRITVNDRAYFFAKAVTFPGEHASDIYPPSASAFLAPRAKFHTDSLCVQGYSNGSGEADRHTQIYLLVEPLQPKGRGPLLHLPGLLSSCRAIVATKNGQLTFPKNSYLLDEAQDTRIGLLVSYFIFKSGHFAPTNNDVRLRFASPGNPFTFSRQDELAPREP